jgi:hypothetical protein
LNLLGPSGNVGDRLNTGPIGTGGLIGIVAGFLSVVCLMVVMKILYSVRSETSIDQSDDPADELSIETDDSMDTAFDMVFDDQLVYDNPLSGDGFLDHDDAEGFTEVEFDETGL